MSILSLTVGSLFSLLLHFFVFLVLNNRINTGIGMNGPFVFYIVFSLIVGFLTGLLQLKIEDSMEIKEPSGEFMTYFMHIALGLFGMVAGVAATKRSVVMQYSKQINRQPSGRPLRRRKLRRRN